MAGPGPGDFSLTYLGILRDASERRHYDYASIFSSKFCLFRLAGSKPGGLASYLNLISR